MKYNMIKQQLEQLKVFSVEDLLIFDQTFRIETLYDWEKKGWVIKLRNKKYCFSDFQPNDKSLYLVANKIYSPSYISLELALNHYGIIPEAVLRITSITTNKTLSVKTQFGVFDYSSIDTKLFFGYKIISENNLTYKIATLEKTLIDYFYLNANFESESDFDALRFNINILRENLDINEIKRMGSLISSPILSKRINLLLGYMK